MSFNKDINNQFNTIKVSENELELSHYSGVVPPVDVMERYEKMHTGAAKIFLEMANKQLEHRIQLENKSLDNSMEIAKSEVKFNIIGLFMSFVIILVFLIGGIVLAVLKGTYGYLTASVIVALITVLPNLFYKKK